MKKKARNKRKPIVCSNCGQEMVCMSRFAFIHSGNTKIPCVWYICPRRKGESGCGQSVLFRISKKTKRLGKIMFTHPQK